MLKTTARPAFKTVAPSVIEYEGRFPRAHVMYKHLTGLHLSLDALGSFDMADASDQYQHSALPLALFILHVENTRADQLPVTLVCSWQNLNGVGGYAGTPINAPDPTVPVFRAADFGPGLWFGHAEASDTDPRVLGDYSLRVWADDPAAEYTYFAGWDPWHNGQDIWDVLTAHGTLNNTQASGTAGALAMRLALPPGASRIAVFALAWHMPHLLAAELKWDHLVRASSAPPPPTSPNRRDYGHAYHQWFQDSWTVAEHGLQEWSNIRDRVLARQNALTNSSLPSRFALALCNDLCSLVSNTWYTRALTRQAEALRERFEQAFWCEELSTYALALDGDKRPCRVRTSNAGQCLFTGIVSPERARHVARTLLAPESFSGWGIRTVAASESRYNPMGYHNGAVWPHDNALIAQGLARYGLGEQALQIWTGLFEAGLYFDLHRMPELFCGFPQEPGRGADPLPGGLCAAGLVGRLGLPPLPGLPRPGDQRPRGADVLHPPALAEPRWASCGFTTWRWPGRPSICC